MKPDAIIGQLLFVDGILRNVYLNDAGRQFVIDHFGRTKLYGFWLPSDKQGADEPLTVSPEGMSR